MKDKDNQYSLCQQSKNSDRVNPLTCRHIPVKVTCFGTPGSITECSNCKAILDTLSFRF